MNYTSKKKKKKRERKEKKILILVPREFHFGRLSTIFHGVSTKSVVSTSSLIKTLNNSSFHKVIVKIK